MADLLDIVPETAVEDIDVTGYPNPITVRGLGGKAIASLATRFPALIPALSAGGNVWQIIEQYGDAIGPAIAAGCGHLGDEQSEKIASELLIEDQFKLIKAIMGLTFPNGLAAFLKELQGLTEGGDEKEKGHKVRLKKSPSASPPSSDADSPPIMQ